MTHFTPVSATLGGVLIGIAATLMLLFSGRITGISGMLGGLLSPVSGEWGWRLLFLLGMVAGALIDHFLDPFSAFTPRSDFPLWLLALAGFCVGFGTRLGSGCTSGHGICGIARLSRRSIIATLLFMGAGVVSVFVVRHIFGVGG